MKKLFDKNDYISDNNKKVLFLEMTFTKLKNKAKIYPLFKLEDVFKWFPEANRQVTLNQLNFWCQKGELENIRRGIYKLSDFGFKDSFD